MTRPDGDSPVTRPDGGAPVTRHYTAAVLASPQARAGWVEPDLAAFGWPSGTEPS